MLCPHCGTENLSRARFCVACNVSLATGMPVRRRPSRLQRFIDAPAAPKALLSLIPCGLAVWEMMAALDRNQDLPMMVSAAGLAALGGALALAVLARPRYPAERRWPRIVAVSDFAVGAAVVAAPVVWSLGQLAMMPRRMAAEPMAVNNARQLAVAIQTYAEDNGGRLPGWVTVNGRHYHNVWDQQIASYVKGDHIFTNGADGRGIRSPTQPIPRQRVLKYALNGLLITRPKDRFDGNGAWEQGPYAVPGNAIANPSGTILLAEVATRKPMGGIYGKVETPPDGRPSGGGTRAWNNALDQWIDIDPRAWVETSGRENSYSKRRWDPTRGVGRDLHAGGAAYAYCDGHVEYHRIKQTVTGGQTGVNPAFYWDPANDANMWRPR